MSNKKVDTNKLADMAFNEALTQLANTHTVEILDASKETIHDGAIERLIALFEDAAQNEDGVEFWYARDLQELLGYSSSWQNFSKVIEKAKKSCELTGYKIIDHFNDVIKMVPIGSGAERQTDDIQLTRYA